MIFTTRSIMVFILEPKKHLWIDVFWVVETAKAILIVFDDQQIWIPKVWIARIKRSGGRSVKIKISGYHWARKFS